MESSASETSSCGDETCPPPVRGTRPIVDASNANEELWAAARDADEKRVKLCLGWNAEVNWVKKVDCSSAKEEVLTYRGWKMSSQALHVAVLYAAHETCDNKQTEQAKAIPVVEMLLSHRADVNAFAEREYYDREDRMFRCRRVQTIHMAAGAGNSRAVELLLMHGADKNAEAVLDISEPCSDASAHRMVLFRPIHDAVLYDRVECVEVLLRSKVDIGVGNIDMNTPLHVAARLGYAHIVELLLGLKRAREAFQRGVEQRAEFCEQSRRIAGFGHLVRKAMQAPHIPVQFSVEVKKLLMTQNSRGMTALELAATGCRFPVEDLYWFVTCQFSIEWKCCEDVHMAVDAFASVAVAFPEVASDLLRIADEGGDSDVVNCVDPQNLCRIRKALTWSSTNEKVFKTFENLSETYPHAAVVMLDALTITAEEKNPVDDPLPRRFVPPRGDLYPLHCVYEYENSWEFNEEEGNETWHRELGGDIRDPVPVTVHTVQLRGFACPKVLSKLARQTSDCLFTKLAVHALLKYTWDSLRYLFILDMFYEGAATIVISRWIVTSSDDAIFATQFVSEFIARVAWCIVAGQASIEAIILMLTGINHMHRLSHIDTAAWALRNVHRICLSVMTLGIACAFQEEHWPSEDAVLSGALGAASFGHWLTILYQVRAFVLTGTRLLPIMKAILPIRGMLVILGFLMIGFVHVFWAIDRSHSNRVGTWQFMTFLFIGDNFINTEKLAGLSEGRQYLLMCLGGFSIFIFTACFLNLFIAVLGELYEQEQERMIATFLRERACICSFLILRPETRSLHGLSPSSWKWSFGMFLACVTSVSLVVGGCTLLQINSWPGALLFAFWAVLHQALIKQEMTRDWGQKYIWYCANLAGIEEIFSLGHAQRDQMLPRNRAWKLKRYITEITSKMQKQNETQKADFKRMENALSKMQTQNEIHEADLKRVENAQKGLEAMLSQAVHAIKSLDAKWSGPPAASTAHIVLSEHQNATVEPVVPAHLEVVAPLQPAVSVLATTSPGTAAAAAPTRRKRGPKGSQRGQSARGSAEPLAADCGDGS